MINIKNFKINRKLNPEAQNKLLTDFISDFSKQKSLSFLTENLSNIYKIPNQVFDQDIKNMIFLDFRNSLGKFLPKYGIKNILISFIKYLLFFFWILIFGSKKKKTFSEKINLIIDDVDGKEIFWRLKQFAEKVESYKIIVSYKSHEPNTYIWDNYKNLNISRVFDNFNKIFFLIFLSLVYSLRERTDFVGIIFNLNRKIIKYSDIFSNIQSDYLLQDRQFTTSNLKGYIFKKFGGLKTILYQRNIAQLNGPGMYCNSDYFFTLGNLTHKQYLKCEGKFEKIIPVGSFYMNSVLLKKRDENVPVFDLLHLASNMNFFQNTHSSFMDDWLEQFRWLVKFAKKFENKKVGIKGREGDGLRTNKQFMDIINNSPIKFIDSFQDSNHGGFKGNSLHSYEFAFKAKINCTWQSTMGFELVGHGKPCLFLDPGGRNLGFLPNDEFHNNLRVTTYDDFEKEYFLALENKSKVSNLKRDDYCLNSNLTHKKIIDVLKSSKKF